MGDEMNSGAPAGAIVSDFLFARPSFLSGVARLCDLSACFDSYNQSRTPRQADARAMFADWRVVGQEVLTAAAEYRKSNPELFR